MQGVSGQIAGCRVMVDGSVRISVDVPAEHKALWMMDHGQMVAVAPLNIPAASGNPLSSRRRSPPAAGGPGAAGSFADLPPQVQAGILCDDEQFWEFLSPNFLGSDVSCAESAADFVREHCGVQSRRELAHNPDALAKWQILVSDFRGWQMEQRYPDADQA